MKRKVLLVSFLAILFGAGLMFWESKNQNTLSKSFDVTDTRKKTTLTLEVEKPDIYTIRVVFKDIKEEQRRQLYSLPLSLNVAIHKEEKEFLNLDFQTNGIAGIDKKGNIHREIQTFMLESGIYVIDIKVLKSAPVLQEYSPKITIVRTDNDKNF